MPIEASAAVKRRAFTLFELVIVVVIIGLLYGLVSVNFSKSTAPKVTLSTLSDYLDEQPFREMAEVVCTGQRCRNCRVYLDGQETNLTLKLFPDKPVVYRLLPDDTTQAYDFFPLVDELGKPVDVCFRYRIFANGAATEMAVESGDAILFLPAYGQPQEYPSLESLTEMRQNLKRELFD